MSIFKKPSTEQLPLVVSVTGVRLGQRLLVVPGRDRRVLVDLAGRVGLTGRILALVEAEGMDSTQASAERSGVLVDVAALQVPLPVAGESFDLAVVDDRPPRPSPKDTASLLVELAQALRPGGRLVVLLPTGDGLLARLVGGSAEPPAAAALLAAFDHAGFRGGRIVAVRDGVGYLETTRPAD